MTIRTDLLFDLDRLEPSFLELLALFDRFLPLLDALDFRLELFLLFLLRLLRADKLL